MSKVSSKGILWEVLAPVVRWPLRSAGRLVAVVVALVLVLFVSARLSGGDGGDAVASPAVTASTSTAAETPTASPTPTSSTSQSPTPRPSVSPTPTAPAVPAVAVKTASTFLTAWARPTVPQAQWYAAVKPLATPDLAQGLAVTDPRNVPASKVKGALEPREVSPNLTAPTRAVLVADTDGGQMAVTVVLVGKAWLVQSIAPFEQDEA